jgi:hypothetical protein
MALTSASDLTVSQCFSVNQIQKFREAAGELETDDDERASTKAGKIARLKPTELETKKSKNREITRSVPVSDS